MLTDDLNKYQNIHDVIYVRPLMLSLKQKVMYLSLTMTGATAFKLWTMSQDISLKSLFVAAFPRVVSKKSFKFCNGKMDKEL